MKKKLRTFLFFCIFHVKPIYMMCVWVSTYVWMHLKNVEDHFDCSMTMTVSIITTGIFFFFLLFMYNFSLHLFVIVFWCMHVFCRWYAVMQSHYNNACTFFLSHWGNAGLSICVQNFINSDLFYGIESEFCFFFFFLGQRKKKVFHCDWVSWELNLLFTIEFQISNETSTGTYWYNWKFMHYCVMH